MALSVIGAGFGRTGTNSMKTALEMLGYAGCYHMLEVLPDQGRVDLWRAAAKGHVPDWDAVFTGYKATVDWPAAFYWRELSAHFPDAKILLTVRDSEAWYKSMSNTILPLIADTEDPESIGFQLIRNRVFGGDINDKDHVIATYEKNTADVQAAFGPDRLLTYTVGSGWDPLCGFLGCDVPDIEYPHSNATKDFASKVEETQRLRESSSS